MDVNEWIQKARDWVNDLISQKETPQEETEESPEPSLSIGQQLVQQGVLGGDDVNLKLAQQFGMPVYQDISPYRLSQSIYKELPYSFVKKHCVLPIKDEEGTLLVAVADPLNLEPLEEIRMMLGAKVKAIYAPKDAILTAINECYNQQQGAASELLAGMKELEGDKEGDAIETYDLLDVSKEQAPIIKLLNLILTEAIQQGASDIHFEPFEDTLRVRYRIDGVLHTRHTPTTDYMSQLMTRIKVMAKLDIAERRLPQDGRIRLRMGRREIDFRVSTIPVINGERIVLRILDKGNVVLGLDKLGMLSRTFEEFNRLIRLPEGIILVTGPTGSGKTTTLYSAVSDLYNESTNIMTIEDPVEYNLKGIAQMGVKASINLDFAAGLRTILRQDPDIIMVGEIRDVETAEIAIQAALTGHLVMSTLHTNDAPSAITRLVDMGVEPYLLSSCVVGVLAQRLVRTICPHCKEAYTPTTKEFENLKIEPCKELWHGAGCAACYNSGFKGRHGVYELMTVTNDIQKQIVTSPDAVQLRAIARQDKMSTLREHAAYLVTQGVTTTAEAMRILS